MFFLLKWTTFLLVIAGLWYGGSVLLNLKPEEQLRVKKDTYQALETGDASALTDSLGHKIKSDLAEKKASFLEDIRHKLKNRVDRLFDGE